MTDTTSDGATGVVLPSRATRHPEREIFVLSLLIALGAVGLVFSIPDRFESTEPAGWWLVIVLALGFGLAERTIFHFEFAREAIGFSVSEVPTAIALVFLAPGEAIGARLVASGLVLVFLRRTPFYKLVFNLSLFAFELALSYVLLRRLLDILGEDTSDVVVGTIIALVVSSLLTSVLVSVAISRFEGDLLHRIGSELRFGWWLFVVNSSLAGMTLALALIAPALTLLAAVPVGAMWYLIQRYGVVNQQLRDLDAVHGFTGRVGQSLDPETIMEAAVVESATLLRADSAALVVFDMDGVPMTRSVGSIDVRLPTTATDEAWRSFIDADEATLVDRKLLRSFGLDSRSPSAEMIVSSVKDGTEPIGVLVVAGRSGAAHRFGDVDIVRLQSLAEQLASSLGKGLLHQRIEREARHDPLTGLPNRSAFERRVAAIVDDAARPGVRFVLMFDLDRFKEVNDTLGHHAGDELLIEFARRIRAMMRPGDVLARLAGDEFALVGSRDNRGRDARLRRGVRRRSGSPRHPRRARTRGDRQRRHRRDRRAHRRDHGDPPGRHRHLQCEDAAGRHRDLSRRDRPSRRRRGCRCSATCGRRLEREDLRLHYQPKLDLATGIVIGAEALVRWTHAVRGAVPAADFVRVAEDTGLIKQLTDTMLSQGHRRPPADPRPRVPPRPVGQPVDARPARHAAARTRAGLSGSRTGVDP